MALQPERDKQLWRVLLALRWQLRTIAVPVRHTAHARLANQCRGKGSWQIEKQITRALPAFRFSGFACRLFGKPAAGGGGWVVAIEIIVVVVVGVGVGSAQRQPSWTLPLSSSSQFVLIFRICLKCERVAGQTLRAPFRSVPLCWPSSRR